MATFREVLNSVLLLLGEDAVSPSETELTESYHLLVAGFVNFIKEEIEAAHNWSDLSTDHTVTLAAGAASGTITGSNSRSRLSRVKGQCGLIPLVFDVTDPSDPIPLQEVDVALLRYKRATDPDTTTTEPVMFAITGAGAERQLLVYPSTTSDRTITVTMFTPQPRLEADDLDTEITIPRLPLELGATWFGFQERGEELGTSSMFTEERYRKALDDSVATDADEQGGMELQIV